MVIIICIIIIIISISIIRSITITITITITSMTIISCMITRGAKVVDSMAFGSPLAPYLR